MKNMNFTKGDLLTNKINVNLNVLCSSMLNRIRGHVDGGHIVIADKCGRVESAMKLLKKSTEPTTLCNHVSHSAVLCFSTGSRDCSLALGRPRNQMFFS
jgi:hypothetical protein